MNKAVEAILRILGDGWEKWSVPHSQQDLWKSFQPARCTYNLQPDLRESFSADVCTDINGQFGCGRRAILRRSVGEGGNAVGQWLWRTGAIHPVSWGGGGGGVSVNIAILDVKYPQTPRIVFFPRTVSFQGHFITSTSPNQQKIARRTDILSNRSIGCAPVQGLQYYFSKSLVAIYRFTNVRIFLIPF